MWGGMNKSVDTARCSQLEAEIHQDDGELPGLLVSRRAANHPIISSSKIAMHGGPRANSGGARPNSGGPRENSGGFRPGAGRKPKTAAVQPPTGLRWHVAQVVPHQHDLAVRDIVLGDDLISRKAYDVAVPLDYEKKEVLNRKSGLVETVHVRAPMFGRRFVFVQFDEDNDDWRAIRYAHGVDRILLSSSQRPVPVERDLIEKLMRDQEVRLKFPPPVMPVLENGLAVMVKTTPIGVNEFGQDVRHALSGKVGFVESCDGSYTMVRFQILGGYHVIRMRRCELADE